MTEDASPKNLRKFLESDDPALVRMGLSMAKGAGVPEELSGDCDDFAILVSALFELVGLDSGIVFLTNDEGDGHAMSLLHDDLGDYGFQAGNWIIIEPQSPIWNKGILNGWSNGMGTIL